MTREKRFGLTEDQYYKLCREYDAKWEQAKIRYLIPIEYNPNKDLDNAPDGSV